VVAAPLPSIGIGAGRLAAWGGTAPRLPWAMAATAARRPAVGGGAFPAEPRKQPQRPRAGFGGFWRRWRRRRQAALPALAVPLPDDNFGGGGYGRRRRVRRPYRRQAGTRTPNERLWRRRQWPTAKRRKLAGGGGRRPWAARRVRHGLAASVTFGGNARPGRQQRQPAARAGPHNSRRPSARAGHAFWARACTSTAAAALTFQPGPAGKTQTVSDAIRRRNGRESPAGLCAAGGFSCRAANSLVKNGDGTLLLNAINSYSGGTTVERRCPRRQPAHHRRPSQSTTGLRLAPGRGAAGNLPQPAM